MASKISVNHGSGSMDWKSFIKLLNWYREQNPNDAATHAILKLDNMRRAKFSQTESFALRNLVDEFRDAFCELPHDKVYAFIGLANDTVDNEIPVNYQQSEAEVYHDIIRHHFDSLRLETQQASSIEAMYLAALVRRLLTREKIRRPKEIRTLREAVTEDSPKEYVAPAPATQPPQNEVSRGRGDRDRYDNDTSYTPSIYFGTRWSYATPDSTTTRDTEETEEEKEKEEKDEKVRPWNDPLYIALGALGTAGLIWLIWKLLNRKPPEKLTWCWKESSAEDLDKWTTTSTNKQPEEFILRGAIIGKVEHIGPSALDLTTSYDAEKRWNARLGQYYRGTEDLETARGLNEKLLSILSDTADFRTRNIVPLTLEQQLLGRSVEELPRTPVPESTPQRPGESPVLFLGTNVSLGVAPGNIREGDFIVQFWNSNACAVLRKAKGGFRPRFEIVGRASIVGRDENADWDVPADKTRFAKRGIFNQGKVIDLPVSMRTLTLLSLDTVNLPGTTN